MGGGGQTKGIVLRLGRSEPGRRGQYESDKGGNWTQYRLEEQDYGVPQAKSRCLCLDFGDRQ